MISISSCLVHSSFFHTIHDNIFEIIYALLNIHVKLFEDLAKHSLADSCVVADVPTYSGWSQSLTCMRGSSKVRG